VVEGESVSRKVTLIFGGVCSALMVVFVLIWTRSSPAPADVVETDETDVAKPAVVRSNGRQLATRRITGLSPIQDADDPDDDIVAADGGASRFASDDDGLDAAIDDLEPKVQRCYQDVLDLEPGVRGTIDVSFVLIEGNGAGRLDHVRVVDDHVDNVSLTSCIADRISEMSFDAPDADIEVTVPFEFVTDDAERDPTSPHEPDFVAPPPPPPHGERSSTGG
jgi:hypothetical protein